MRDFEGRVAIISGGLGDIGQAIANALLERGAQVALGDLAEAPAELAANSIYHRVDVSDAVAVSAWVAEVESTIGTPDIVIPNAAVVTLADFRTVTAEQWRREIQVNLDGAFHLAQATSLRLLEREMPGRVAFVGSWAAHAVHANMPAYSVSKSAVRMLCRCMALELAPFGILVNEVAPGYVDAGLSAQIFRDHPGTRAIAEEKVPVKALITAEDVAREVVHLCDFGNRHTTGSTVLMDGGLSLVSP